MGTVIKVCAVTIVVTLTAILTLATIGLAGLFIKHYF